MMQSEGSASIHVAGTTGRRIPLEPVVYRDDVFDDRHFHDTDAAGACRTEGCTYLVDAELPDYGRVVDVDLPAELEPSIAADRECSRCGRIPGEISETLKVSTGPEFPDYILAIAYVMRDSEGHEAVEVRVARKAVVTALQGLDRELKAVAARARRVTRGNSTPGGVAANARMAGRDVKAIRKWALAAGVECPTRGRFLPESVLRAYDEAHS